MLVVTPSMAAGRVDNEPSAYRSHEYLTNTESAALNIINMRIDYVSCKTRVNNRSLGLFMKRPRLTRKKLFL